MAEMTGFMAIQPPAIQAPYARRKIVRGPDGTPQVLLVDAQTGQTITDPTGYSIIEAGNYYNPENQQATPAPSLSDAPQTPQRQSTANTVIRESRGGSDLDSPSSGGSFGRSQANNFGYINKPGLLGMAGVLPGVAGLVGKGVNAGINANNVAAVSAARGTLGLPSLGIGGTAKGIVKDNKGQVADVSFGDSKYATPVGLEALSPEGMTNMTPREAQARAQANGSIRLSTPEEIAARNEAFEAEFSKPGILSRVGNVASSFVDSMFGTDLSLSKKSYYQPNESAAKSIRDANSGSNFNPTKSGFSDMLGGSGKQATSTPKSPVSGASRSTAGKTSQTSGRSLSPGASAAIDRGQGGLY